MAGPDAHLAPVEIRSASGEAFPATARVETRSGRQAFFRAGKRSLRWVGGVALLCLPFAFLEPFLFMIWGSVVFGVLFLLVGPFLHLMLSDEKASFTFVEGKCPHCAWSGKLKPYLSTRFEAEFTVLCPECGQTSRAAQLSSRSGP